MSGIQILTVLDFIKKIIKNTVGIQILDKSVFQMVRPITIQCGSEIQTRDDVSDGRSAASYPADPGSNLAVSGSYEIALKE